MVCLLPLGHRRGRQPHSSCSGGCGAFCRPGSPSPQPPVALGALGQQVLGLCPQSLGGRGGVKLTCSQQARTSERLSPILLGAPGPLSTGSHLSSLPALAHCRPEPSLLSRWAAQLRGHALPPPAGRGDVHPTADRRPVHVQGRKTRLRPLVLGVTRPQFTNRGDGLSGWGDLWRTP